MAEETCSVCHWCSRKCTCAGPCRGGNGCSILHFDERLLCGPCANRDCPPHHDYVHKLFRTTLDGDKHMTDIITQFAYPVCEEPFMSACYKCESNWVGYRCSVCKRLATGGRPLWEFLATTTFHTIWRHPTAGAPLLQFRIAGLFRDDIRGNAGGWACGSTNGPAGEWRNGWWNERGTWISGRWWNTLDFWDAADGGGGWTDGGGGCANGWDWGNGRDW